MTLQTDSVILAHEEGNMNNLTIVADGPLTCRHGNFEAIVDKDTLRVPSHLAVILKRRNVIDLRGLIRLTTDSPTLLAQDLGWTLGEVQQALTRLIQVTKIDPLNFAPHAETSDSTATL